MSKIFKIQKLACNPSGMGINIHSFPTGKPNQGYIMNMSNFNSTIGNCCPGNNDLNFGGDYFFNNT